MIRVVRTIPKSGYRRRDALQEMLSDLSDQLLAAGHIKVTERPNDDDTSLVEIEMEEPGE